MAVKQNHSDCQRSWYMPKITVFTVTAIPWFSSKFTNNIIKALEVQETRPCCIMHNYHITYRHIKYWDNRPKKFCCAQINLWNRLLTSIRNNKLSLNCFHSEVKTFYFCRAYPCNQVFLWQSPDITVRKYQISELNTSDYNILQCKLMTESIATFTWSWTRQVGTDMRDRLSEDVLMSTRQSKSTSLGKKTASTNKSVFSLLCQLSTRRCLKLDKASRYLLIFVFFSVF